VATANGQDKFATYYRDVNGLDYADQRYYWSAMGRFLTPDPYQASGGPTDPQSWNRYAYVQGDPINYNDAAGLARAAIFVETAPITVTASAPGVPLVDIIGLRRDSIYYSEHWLETGTFIPLGLERELRCERASATELSDSDLEEFLGSIEMDAEEQAELFAPAGKDDGRNDVLPAFVVAAATAANWGVYWARTPQGQYYIGVTSNFLARQAAQAARGLRIELIQSLQGLNYAAAKGVEQNLIESLRRNGQSFVNKINSISPNNRFYQQFTGMGHQVLRDCRAKLPEGFPWP
jgi:RHS repeat-associated protein